MRRRLMATCVAAGLAAAGVVAASVTAGGDEAGPGAPAGGPVVSAHPVAAPSVAGAKAPGKADGGLTVVYRETDPQTVPINGQALTVKKCPKNAGPCLSALFNERTRTATKRSRWRSSPLVSAAVRSRLSLASGPN